jgi:hypothetical protein
VSVHRFSLLNTPKSVKNIHQNMKENDARMELLLMDEPFELGTFRCAYYGKDRVVNYAYSNKSLDSRILSSISIYKEEVKRMLKIVERLDLFG